MDSDAARLLIKQELADGGVCRNTASQGSGGRIQFLVKCSQILDQLVATWVANRSMVRLKGCARRCGRVNIESSREIVAASKRLVAEVSDVILPSRHQRSSWVEV